MLIISHIKKEKSLILYSKCPTEKFQESAEGKCIINVFFFKGLCQTLGGKINHNKSEVSYAVPLSHSPKETTNQFGRQTHGCITHKAVK